MKEHKSRCNKYMAILNGLVAWSFSHASFSATATGTLAISATILDLCSVVSASSAVAFSPYVTGSNDDVVGTISILCTNATPYTIALGVGNGTGADYTSRKMTGTVSQELLNYNLYTTAARTTVWGDGTSGTDTVPGSGTGVAQLVSVYGRIPSGQSSVSPDVYTDSVAITVTY